MMGGPLFHAFMMNAEDDEEHESVPQMNPFQKNKTTWNESEENYIFHMDVPGVKAHQITIEEKDGEIEVTAIRLSHDNEVSKTYQEILYVRPSAVDLSNTVATLDNGVLAIVVPKKSNEPLDIQVESAAPPEPTVDGNEFRASMDMPGVKTTDLKAQIRQDKVYVEATRQVGDRVVTIRRIIEVQPSSVDVGRARAFLQDGVLTFAAPILEENEAKSPGMRTIRVTPANDAGVPSAFASLSLNEDAGQGEEAPMVVETVAEDNDKEEWEKVNEDGKKAAGGNN
jgi:HSP20 family molecular chaperone IbpA